MFHELAHSTGHPTRLARFENAGRFGSHGYGKEELCAQWAAAILNSEAGIAATTEQQSAAYLASWIDTIKADRKLVVSAAAAGQKAANLILTASQPAQQIAA